MGFSWASANAARRRARSAAPRAAGTGGGGSVVEVCAELSEEAGGSDVAVTGGRLSRDVISRIWASTVSVGIVGRERVRLTMVRRARRDLFRLARRLWSRSWRIDFARARRSFRISLGGSRIDGSEFAGAGAGSDDGEGSSVESFCFFLNWRVALRSSASLEAPVAYMTRSGSTWNMSPGLSW